MGGVVVALLNGGFAGMLHALLRYLNRSIFGCDYPFLKRRLDLDIPITTLLKKELLTMGINTMVSLGTFEILTKNLRMNGNHGRPLSLYQEAWCGLISTAASTFALSPLLVALNRVGLKNMTYTNWFTTLSHFVRHESPSTLFRSSGKESTGIAASAALLVTYDRSRAYLIETRGLSKRTSQLSASVMGGISFSACHFAAHYVGECMKSKQLNKDRLVTRLICGFFKSLPTVALFCMAQYTIYEVVCGVEWSKLYPASFKATSF